MIHNITIFQVGCPLCGEPYVITNAKDHLKVYPQHVFTCKAYKELARLRKEIKNKRKKK